MRNGAGPPARLSRSSTSSVIVRTWRGLDPLVMTKASVMASTSPTERITLSSPPLAQAARAATSHQSRTRSRVTSAAAPDRGAGPLTGASLAYASRMTSRNVAGRHADRP